MTEPFWSNIAVTARSGQEAEAIQQPLGRRIAGRYSVSPMISTVVLTDVSS